MKRDLLASAALALAALLAGSPAATGAAPQTAAGMPESTRLAPADLKWMPAPPVIPPGVQLAVLRGDPFAEGIFTIRLKIPPHYTFPPHWHPTAESFSVLSGTLFIGMGDNVDRSKAKALPAMSFAALPAVHHHYAYTGDQGTVIDLTGYGPFQIYYVNPADAPTKIAGKP
ncbi:MAG TPA: cupin domain-containing protein [Rhodanobacteraceae bacterium]|nr:cupin domain-containing protein [Rhodanobacteraceae bacterium]